MSDSRDSAASVTFLSKAHPPPGFARWWARQPAGLRRATRSIGWLGLEQAVRMLTGLAVGIYVARHLGPDGYGVIGYATALMLVGSALSRMGLAEIVTRDLVRDPAACDLVLGSAFLLRLWGGLLAYGALLLYGLHAAMDSQTRLAVLIIGAGVLAQPFDMAGAWFHARQRLAYTALARLTGVLVTAALRIGFVATDKPLLWFAWPVVAEIAIGAALILAAYTRVAGNPLRWRAGWRTLRALLAAALPLTLAIATNELSLRLPQVLLMHWATTADVGYYAAATRLSEALYLLPVIACTALFPAVVRAHASGPQVYARRMEALYGVLLWGGLAVALPLSLLAPWLIRQLFGADYAPAAEVLSIHAWSLPLVGLGVARARTLIAEGLTRFNLIAAAVTLTCSLLLAWWLIPAFGAVGAAWAGVLPRLIGAVAINFLFAPTRPQGVVMLRALWFPWRLPAYLRARRSA